MDVVDKYSNPCGKADDGTSYSWCTMNVGNCICACDGHRNIGSIEHVLKEVHGTRGGQGRTIRLEETQEGFF